MHLPTHYTLRFSFYLHLICESVLRVRVIRESVFMTAGLPVCLISCRIEQECLHFVAWNCWERKTSIELESDSSSLSDVALSTIDDWTDGEWLHNKRKGSFIYFNSFLFRKSDLNYCSTNLTIEDFVSAIISEFWNILSNCSSFFYDHRWTLYTFIALSF